MDRPSSSEPREQNVAAPQASLSQLLDAVPAAAYICALDGRLLQYNEQAAVLWGRRPALNDPDELYCGSYRLWTCDGLAIERHESWMARALRDKQPYVGREVVIERPDGSRRVAIAHASPLRGAAGDVTGAVNVLVDVTDDRRTAAALRESEERFAAFMRNMPLVAYMKDEAGRHVYVNDAFERLFGRRLADCIGKTDAELWPAETARQFRASDERVLKSGSPEAIEETLDRRGSEHWMSYKFPIRDAAGQLLLAGMSLNITRRKQAEAELRRTSDLLQAVADGTTDAIFVKDMEGRYLFCNEATARFVGRPAAEVLSRTDAEIFEPASAQVIRDIDRRVMESGRAHTHEEELTAAGVTRTYLVTKAPYRNAHGRVAGLIGISRDITLRKQAERENKQLEQQLRQSQKMEAVGRLAGGVAHDFNNLLTIISGYSQLLETKLDADSPLRASVQAIYDASLRAASLTRQLLAYSRKQMLDPSVLNLNDAVRAAEAMLRRLIGEDVLLEVELDPQLSPVLVDRGQIEQVIMNLVVNARDTMPRGGRLAIATRNVPRSAADSASGEAAADYVELAVSDTGHGMTDEMKGRIFDPFFTTKEQGKGTGLGLAVVQGIVSQSGGRVEVDSQLGAGSTFRVLLPATHQTEAASPAADALASARGGEETILLVEDDDAVRQFALLALADWGYRVLSARSGAEALALVQRETAPIDLLVSDVVMPEMSGPRLAARLQERFADLRVLYISGYADDAMIRHGLLQSPGAFLHKPYTPTALAAKVRELLDAVASRDEATPR